MVSEYGNALTIGLPFFILIIIYRISQFNDPSVQIFTTFFFSMLQNSGGSASISSWLIKRKINVFKKQLVLIPINMQNHWLICVIVNAHVIKPNQDNNSIVQPCILIFDSLKYHNKVLISSKIRTWLNFEWHCLHNSNAKINFIIPQNLKTYASNGT